MREYRMVQDVQDALKCEKLVLFKNQCKVYLRLWTTAEVTALVYNRHMEHHI